MSFKMIKLNLVRRQKFSQKSNLKKIHPAVPTKTVLMLIFFFFFILSLHHWFLIFIHCISSYFHLFKCRNILAIFKILWLFLSQMAKMALRYYTTSSYRVGNNIFPSTCCSADNKGEATNDAPSAATPCYLLIYSTKISFKLTNTKIL